jgi:biotin synthase
MNPPTIASIYFQDLSSLVESAHTTHLQHFPEKKIQASSLLSIKTGGCPENCAYCPQSAHYETGVHRTSLMKKSEVLQAARQAKLAGASRFCMGAAWKSVKDGPDFDEVIEFVKAVREEGLETCCTLGMLTLTQAQKLKKAGLQFYNHNIDTSRAFYEKIVQTRTYDDRLQTLENVREAGLRVCTGGILGMGESHEDRIAFIEQLASMNPPPESITVNALVAFTGTPLEKKEKINSFDLVRVIATLRITHPNSMIRLSAGRLGMSQEAQFLCFYSGANSIFFGEKLLTSPNPSVAEDQKLMDELGYTWKTASPH